MTPPPVIHDLIGIGFGPSNVALAIALDEARQKGGPPLNTVFIEKQAAFAWHQHMLLDGAHMQISYLKDLATLRNPCSRFTFVNYLHEKNRLQDFINLKTFFPSRHEFNDYLAWSAAHFKHQCIYGEEVVEVLPETVGHDVRLLCVRSRDRQGGMQARLTRNLVISVGGAPKIPACFQALKNDPRVFHTQRYLADVERQSDARRIAVIGAGQSATEVFLNLNKRPSAPQVDLIMRGRSIKPSDDSAFVNEIFNADFTDYVFSRSDTERAALLDEFWHTNYAAPDRMLLAQLFDVFYQQRVRGQTRHRFLRRHEVCSARADNTGVFLTLFDLDQQRETTTCYDAVVLGTGYERDLHKALLRPLSPYLGDFEVDRHYRLRSTAHFHPGIYLQGACEATHGLSDTLLSVTAVRTHEIGQSLLEDYCL
jgi:lysine N6-hydroxylase/L-ornithine N5-oxygenase